MTAHQESNESKDGQKDDWHVSRLFVFILFQVNLLQADGIMAKEVRSLSVRDGTVRKLPLRGLPEEINQWELGPEAAADQRGVSLRCRTRPAMVAPGRGRPAVSLAFRSSGRMAGTPSQSI